MMSDRDFDALEAQLGENGNCWWCDSRDPITASVITVGPLSMTVAMCEKCDKKVHEDINGDDD